MINKIFSLLFGLLFIISASVTMVGLVENQHTKTNAIGDAADLLFGTYSSESLNWAGYAVTGSNITNVSGSFVVPSLSTQITSHGPSHGPNAGAVRNFEASAASHTGISAYKNTAARGNSGSGSTSTYAAFWAGMAIYSTNFICF